MIRVDDSIRKLTKKTKGGIIEAKKKYLCYMVETREFKSLFNLLTKLEQLKNSYDEADVRIHLTQGAAMACLRGGVGGKSGKSDGGGGGGGTL